MSKTNSLGVVGWAKEMDAFTPAALSSIFAWYRADLGVTGTTTVTAWADQIGSNDLANNGVPALDTTTEAFPYITFPDTAGDCLFNDSVSGWSGNIQHVFMVMETVSVASGDVLLGLNQLRPGGTGVFTRGFRINVASLSITDGTTSIDAAVTPSTGTWAWTEGYLDAANSTIIVNNNPVGAGTGTLADEVLDRIIVPARTSAGFSAASCNVAEIIVCSAEVTGADLSSLRSYITARYGISTL